VFKMMGKFFSIDVIKYKACSNFPKPIQKSFHRVVKVDE